MTKKKKPQKKPHQKRPKALGAVEIMKWLANSRKKPFSGGNRILGRKRQGKKIRKKGSHIRRRSKSRGDSPSGERGKGSGWGSGNDQEEGGGHWRGTWLNRKDYVRWRGSLEKVEMELQACGVWRGGGQKETFLAGGPGGTHGTEVFSQKHQVQRTTGREGHPTPKPQKGGGKKSDR